MIKLKFALALVAAAIFAAPANAFHPSEETYGYMMPKKFRKAGRREAKQDDPWLKSSKANSKKSKSAFWNDDDDDDDDDDFFGSKKSKKFKQKSSKKGPKTAGGGGKPHISAVSPPKVSFPNGYGKGTIVIDTKGRRLYYVLSSKTAYRYPVAVGKQGFTWSGTEKISRKVAWPDWRPPAEMIARTPSLPEHMSGGVRNPLGAMALYLGNSLYRIHGTNNVKSIGTASSSGCIRMTNGHVMHLSKIAKIGTTVHVLNKLPKKIAKAANSDNG